ncbi:ABC transporter permease [Pseudoalteromonas sp. T1lg48]|uniref:ABC transporter permease n=1 Tax=Pseudoalteromonas sp. T1lg48 TaxID=2077100 RepID=UPI000CF6E812|nr:ABC transporter permease [Pseudoalteromonas sp. T1lg48]
MTKSLLIDLLINWSKQTYQSKKLLLAIVLVALPLSILVSFSSIKATYLSPTFAGLEANTPIHHIVLKEAESQSPLEPYLAEEIAQTLAHPILYERTVPLSLNYLGRQYQTNISFFSGAYKSLNLTALKGSLSSLDFPKTGAEASAAIGYHFWQEQLSGEEVIGKYIAVNGKAVKIVAILPPEMESLRKGVPLDLLMAFNQQSFILDTENIQLTPDTYSYIITEPTRSNEELAQSLSAHLIEQGLLLEEDKISITAVFGIHPQQFEMIVTRVNILMAAFSLLLLFCFIAFLTVFNAQCHYKQEELIVRQLCGASYKQITWQGYLESTATALLIVLIAFLLTPVSNALADMLLPSLKTGLSATDKLTFSRLGVGMLILVILIMNVFYTIQSKWIKTPIGRGASASKSQILQSHTLLALMLSLSFVTLYSATLLLHSQYNIYHTDLGFDTTQRYYVSFEFPEQHDIRMYSQFSLAQLEQMLMAKEEINQAGAAITFH